MTQKRVVDYGAPVVASTIKRLIESFGSSIVLDGFRFSVGDATSVRVNPGTAVTDAGVIITEDEAKLLTVPNTTLPTQYTVYYDHEDLDISGGVPATLNIAAALYTASEISGVILGYINYPGGGVALNESHFLQEPTVELGSIRPTPYNASWTVPLGNNYIVDSVGANIALNETYDVTGAKPEYYLKAINAGLLSETASVIFPAKISDYPPGKLQMRASIPINTVMSITLTDSDGNDYSVATNITNYTDLTLIILDLPKDAVYTSNTIVYVKLLMQIASAREIRLQSIGLSEYVLPV